MRRVIFVGGTDTGVGKTVVATGIVRALRDRGATVLPVKPVETGCDDLDRPDDALALHRAAGGGDLAAICPVRYRTPAAPWSAARREGVKHTFDGLRAHIDALDAPWVVVEGAGGLLVPIDATHSFADLARAVGATLVLVSRNALGTINHTRLSLEAARARGLPVAAVVANGSPGPGGVSHVDELRDLGLGVPVLGPLPVWSEVHLGTVAEAVEAMGLVDVLAAG